MRELTGIAVSQGISIHEAFVVDNPDAPVAQKTIRAAEVAGEVEALRRALEEAADDIARLQSTAKIGTDHLDIFKFHRMMLQDPALLAELTAKIEDDQLTAESAVAQVLRTKIEAIKKIDDDFFSQRDKDILDVKRRIHNRLTGRKLNDLDHLARPVVVVAHDLTPTQTVTMPRKWVRGFVTEAGGRTSHTALIARNLAIPAVVGLGKIEPAVENGTLVIVDGTAGRIIVDPDDEVLEEYRRREREFLTHEEAIRLALAPLPAETPDGHRVSMLANIELPAEIDLARDHGCEGIGLFRTEFLWAENPFPSVEFQLDVYKEAIVKLKGRPLTIRTFDMGADKVFEGMGLPPQPNPFLGLRSLRLCFRHMDMLKNQVRAILLASYYGDTKILFPMISSVEEMDRALEVLEEVKEEMREEGLEGRFDEDIEVGAMIEVPAAAVIAPQLAQRVNFFSIGTNDLIQYALAVDRTNETVADLYQPAHPAILTLISQVLAVGETASIDVTMCGEMSGDLRYVILLLGMGLRHLSVAPAMISDLKHLIRSVTMEQAVEVWREISKTHEAAAAEASLTKHLRRLVPRDAANAILGDTEAGP